MPLLLHELTNEYALVRFFVRRALSQLTHHELHLDTHASAAEIEAEARRQLGVP